MPANRQSTLDDLEPVLSDDREDILDYHQVKPCSTSGRRLYERLQELKELQLEEDPLFD